LDSPGLEITCREREREWERRRERRREEREKEREADTERGIYRESETGK
jgi:hypothetical protein